MANGTLEWVKCDGAKWCPFMTVNLTHQHFQGLEGVYIIWHGGQEPWTVYVGQGDIADRIAAHRQEPTILRFLSLDSSSRGRKLTLEVGTELSGS